MYDPNRALARCMFCGEDLTENDGKIYMLGEFRSPDGFACDDCVRVTNGYELSMRFREEAREEDGNDRYEARKRCGIAA